MVNLLIVDDEPLITDSLYDLFAGREDCDFNIMKAYSGREAVGWMESARVDILLTDISMPDINGLEVHRRVSALWPECAVIYLTSFDDFEYVQQAIRNDGEDYILKTEGDRAVLSAVEKAAERLAARQRDRLLLEQARNSLTLALPLLQARFISDLAEAVETMPDDLAGQLESLRLPLNAGYPVLLVLGRVDSWPAGTATERMKRVYSARNTMEAYFAGVAVQACAVHDRNELILLLQPDADGQEPPDPEQYARMARALALRVSGSLDSLQALCSDSCGLALSIAASGSLTAWKDIGAVYDGLRMKLHGGTGHDGKGLLYFDHGGQDGQSHAPSAYMELRQQTARLGLLKTCLENGDREGFLEQYESVMAAGLASGRDAQAELYHRMSAMLTEYVNKWETKAAEGRQLTGRPVSLEGHGSWEQAAGYFRELAESLFARQRSESQKNENRIFAFIRDYTQKNIGGDLSLTRFAMLLNFHPFYLSRLFKQIAGMSLSDYVTGVKLEKAKEMLGQGNSRVTDISTALGFMTSSYFTSFFRKHTGMSPVEYRNSPPC